MEKITITTDDAKMAPFDTDVSKELTDNETIKGYLKYILEQGDIKDLEMALKDIAKAKGVRVTHNSISNILKTLGLKIEIKTVA
jgi:DNA-binding phage protein